MKVLLSISFFCCILNLTFGQNAVVISPSNDVPLLNHLTLCNDPGSTLTIKDVIYLKNRFLPFEQISSSEADQWIHFKIFNPDSLPHNAKVSIAFVDFISCYVLTGNSIFYHQTGDLLPIGKRNLKIGQMCLVDIKAPAGEMVECYLKLHSTTAISKQFRAYSIRSVQLYSESAFTDRFVTSRIYQALFFGAILMMLLYNLFIFSTTRSRSYLAYVAFLLSLILFMASNNGYITELFLPDTPRTDLYLRLLSAPFTLIAFLAFSNYYLESGNYPALNKIINGLIFIFIGIITAMISGFWLEGRTLTIIVAVISFFIILVIAFIIMNKGFTPARYFIIANFLLLAGAVFYALERYHFVIQNPLTQYSVQLSVIFQSVFFSIGLADRIKLVQLQIANIEVEKEKLETQRQTEIKNLTEEKNIALEASNKELDAFIYKTAHDIKGPIARLMGLSNLGLLEVKDTKAVSYLNMLKNNAYYLNYLINRLSTTYEIRNKSVNKTDFNFENLIKNDVMKELSFHEDFSDVIINIEVENNLIINSDHLLLRFIMINLLENAVKFKDNDNDNNSIHVIISKSNNLLQISIHEYGIGIKEEDVPFVFEMFSRAAGKYKTPGLGLYMSKLCVEKLNGTIRILNTYNPTIFEITIPC